MNHKEFQRRRRQLMRMIGEGSVAIIPAAPQRVRNRDVLHPYRQDSDFHYLTGFPEPQAALVLVPGRGDGEVVLFCRARDPAKEIWDGHRAGLEGACSEFGADQAFLIDDIDCKMPDLLEHCERVYYTMGHDPEYDRNVISWVNQIRAKVRSGSRTPGEFVSLEHLLHDMRLYKTREELRAIKRAIKVSVAGHKRAMQACKPGLLEYEVEAEFMYELQRAGMEVAYPSIVGGGKNACILHYIENNEKLNDGDLLLIDAGAESELYAADITRTFPVNGRFSAAQRELYAVVLAAQKAAIQKVKPGNHWNDPHVAAIRVLTQGLVELGILKGKLTQLIKQEAYRPYYMHRTGHWLGLDVHDVGDYKVDGQWRVLEPGMLLTVEPGLYIAPDAKKVAKKWRGIGIRLEDDVLVTKTGNEVLSAALPKEIDAVEALCAN